MTFPEVVLVYGPGAGLGKSTLGRALVEELGARGRTARFVGEEVLVLPAFREYVGRVRAGHACDTAALVEACRRFVAELRGQPTQTAVVDSVLPCWDWLHGAGCSDAAVCAFSTTLAEALSPLRPVLVFVEGDPEAALSRAVGDRGRGWALGLAELRTGRRDLGALAAYFRRLREGAERALAAWPHRVVRVDTVALDLETCVGRTIAAIGHRAPG